MRLKQRRDRCCAVSALLQMEHVNLIDLASPQDEAQQIKMSQASSHPLTVTWRKHAQQECGQSVASCRQQHAHDPSVYQ